MIEAILKTPTLYHMKLSSSADSRRAVVNYPTHLTLLTCIGDLFRKSVHRITGRARNGLLCVEGS